MIVREQSVAMEQLENSIKEIIR